jgi:cell division protein ZipA
MPAIEKFVPRFKNSNRVVSDINRVTKLHQSHDKSHSSVDLGFDRLDSMFTHNDNATISKPVSIAITQQTLPNIITFNVLAKPGQQFVGYDLLQALSGAGLRFGDMSIFHRYQDADRGGKAIFSLASATEPGIFDMNKMGVYTSKGLTLFMQLKEMFHNHAALELMHMTAEQLAEDLDGILCDDKRQPLTQEKLNFYRECVRQHQEIALQESF